VLTIRSWDSTLKKGDVYQRMSYVCYVCDGTDCYNDLLMVSNEV